MKDQCAVKCGSRGRSGLLRKEVPREQLTVKSTQSEHDVQPQEIEVNRRSRLAYERDLVKLKCVIVFVGQLFESFRVVAWRGIIAVFRYDASVRQLLDTMS